MISEDIQQKTEEASSKAFDWLWQKLFNLKRENPRQSIEHKFEKIQNSISEKYVNDNKDSIKSKMENAIQKSKERNNNSKTQHEKKIQKEVL